MYYKTASIILNSDQKSNSVSDIFIAQPDASKEALAGKLFILAEIGSQKSDAIKIINFLINNINFNYYQNEKIVLKERIESILVEHIFETTLAKTNHDLIEFLEREKIKINPNTFNVTVSILYKNELYFSSVGKNKLLLIYKEQKPALKKVNKRNTESVPQENEYKIIDINSGNNKKENVSFNKLFSDIISGKIPAGGSFIIVNEALSEYLSGKQLTRIVTTLSPASAAEQIKNTLEKVNAFVSFLGILIKSTTNPMLAEEIKKEVEEEDDEDDYRPRITDMEERTEEILKPAGIINLKKGFKNLTGKLNKGSKKPVYSLKKTGKNSFIFKDKVFFKKRIPSLKKIFIVFLNLGKIIISIFLFIFKMIFNKEERSKLLNKVRLIKNKGEERGGPIISLKMKIILIVAVSFLIIFTINLIVINKKNKAEEEKRQFNAIIAQIEKNQNKIEANLLYSNENKAKELAEENKNLISQISEEEKEQKHFVTDLVQKHNLQIENIRHVVKVENPKEIANFSNLNNKASSENLILLKDSLYSADAKEAAIYKVNTEEDLITAIYIKKDLEEMKFPNEGPDNNIYYLNKNNIIEITKREEINSFGILVKNGSENISGIRSYGGKLYLIDKKAGQIYKYAKQGDNFIEGEAWFDKEKDFSDSADLFIDGNIFILFKDGRIEKYLKGSPEDFSVEKTYIPVKNASRLIVKEDNLYILEIKEKRVLEFDYEGKFLKQYVFPNLLNIKDFAITDEKIYILNKNSVFETELQK